jgi:hypothetical protein
VPQVLERLALQVELLAASVRDGCARRGCTGTHTRVGRRELARDWRVHTDYGKPKEPKPALGQNGIASSNE